MHRDIREHFPVERDAGEVQRVDELAVGQPFRANRGVDALDPQGAEATLLHLAVAIGVMPGLLDGLAGDPDRVLAAAVIALRIVEDALVLGAGGYTPFDACHRAASLLQAVRGPGLHARRIGVCENFRAAVLADILGVMADQAVALARDTMLDLARRRELEALL